MSDHQALDAAAALIATTEKTLSMPAAIMLPASARQLIRELARVVHLLAVEVESCKVKTR